MRAVHAHYFKIVALMHVQTHEIYKGEIPAIKYFRSCSCIWICTSFLLNCVDLKLHCMTFSFEKIQWQTKHIFFLFFVPFFRFFLFSRQFISGFRTIFSFFSVLGIFLVFRFFRPKKKYFFGFRPKK